MATIDVSRYTKKPTVVGKAKPEQKISGSDLLSREIRLPWSKTVPDAAKEAFYQEMGSLLSSGVDLKMAMEIFCDGLKKPALRQVFSAIQKAVISGKNLSDATAEFKDFGEYEKQSLRIGEETGRLSFIMIQLGIYYKEKIQQRKKLSSAMVYPIMVLSTSMGAILFMLQFVVPMFSDVFLRFGGELPALTRFVLSASEAVKAGFPYFLGVILITVLVLYQAREKEKYRMTMSNIQLAMPLLGDLIRYSQLSRFCSTLSLLVESSVPLVRAIDLISRMSTFYPMEMALAAVRVELENGSTFHEALSRHAIFPTKLCQLLKVGEEINRLDHFSRQLAEGYKEDLGYKTQNIASVMEPFIIIFLGLIVGVILVAMYLPMFQMGNQVQ